MSVTPRQLTQLLAGAVKARLPIMITGKPGIGKSDIVTQVALMLSFKLILSHPVVSDPTDAKGLPWPDKDAKKATFLPFGDLAEATEAKEPTLWFLDDLGQSNPAVQASFMQLILARRVNGHVLPDWVTFVAATNRRVDRAGVSGILEPVKSRFASIVELEPNIDDWCEDYAYPHNLPAHGIAFLRFKPDLFSAFQPTADLTNSPTPRTWSNAFKMESLNLPKEIELEAISGSVGAGAAAEYLAFRQMYKSLTSIDAVLLNPDTAPIPTKPDEKYAIAVGLASKANEKNFNQILTYANRLVDSGNGEFGVLTIKDSTRRNPKLTHTDTFARMASSQVGRLYAGSTK